MNLAKLNPQVISLFKKQIRLGNFPHTMTKSVISEIVLIRKKKEYFFSEAERNEGSYGKFQALSETQLKGR